MSRILIIIISLILVFFISPYKTFAQEVKTDYQVEYFLDDKIDDLETKVKLNIKILYLKSDVLIDKFTLFFADNFKIRNITASINNESIAPIITPADKKIKIELNLSTSKIGKGKENNIVLEFYQDNLFKINGNVWEVILPKIAIEDSSSYRVIVDLPKNTDKKISISKPKPDLIEGKKIIWENVTNKTIYAVFGSKQIYQLKLDYHLKNPDIFHSYSYIAIPPDTLYQKIYIDSLDPAPVSVLSDEDGNYLAKYVLKPKETRTITFNGAVEVFAQPRREIIPISTEQIKKQEEYLLIAQKNWLINNNQKIKNLKNTDDIYSFVTNNLKYNYNRALVKDKRLGADKILKSPDLATCVDFTDLFVALSRKNGIRSREIEGYGFSQDQNLRPLSGSMDILHAWPEYFNYDKSIWVPLDPTWENTSGIDYHNSFDLNHIAFVIHGKDSEYPFPAGMYKIDNSKDITVEVSKVQPKEKINLKVEKQEFPANINDKEIYKGKLTLKNDSNVYLWNFYIDIYSDDLKIEPNKIQIDSIAPFADKDIEFSYKSKYSSFSKKAKISVAVFNKPLLIKDLNITSFYFGKTRQIVGISFATIFLIGFVIILRRKRVR